MSVAKTLILIAAFVWVGKMVVDAIRDVRQGDLVLHVRAEWLALSGAGILLTYLLLIWAWRYIVAELSGVKLEYLTAARIWFISNLGSQLPGRVWGIIQMGTMSADVGVNPVAAGTASIINTAVNIATGWRWVSWPGRRFSPRPSAHGPVSHTPSPRLRCSAFSRCQC